MYMLICLAHRPNIYHQCDVSSLMCSVKSLLPFMAALWNMAGHYIFILWFLLLSIVLFSSSITSAVADYMSTILPHIVWP